MKRWLLLQLMRWWGRARDSDLSLPVAPRSILLWHFGGVGDMLLASPVIAALERKFPGARIHLWCSNPAFGGFLRRWSSVEEVCQFPVYDFDSRTLMQRGKRQLLRQLQDAMVAQQPDLLINLHVPSMLDWWAVEWWLIQQLAVPYSMGFTPALLDGQSVYNRSINAALRDGRHYTELYCMLLDTAGIACAPATCFPLTDDDRNSADALMQGVCSGERRVICMHVGGNRLQLENSMWPIARFAALANALLLHNVVILLIGTDQENEMIEQVCAQAPGCRNLAGQTDIGGMAALIAKSDLFIGHDSGPFHIAVAVGTPAVAICGRPDAESEYLHYNQDGVVVCTGNTPDEISEEAVLQQAMERLA
ncbi:MAG: glycosyltransferase family 9 protein [Mariprofundales bacterium]